MIVKICDNCAFYLMGHTHGCGIAKGQKCWKDGSKYWRPRFKLVESIVAGDKNESQHSGD